MSEAFMLFVVVAGIFMCGWYAGKIHMIVEEMRGRDRQRGRK